MKNKNKKIFSGVVISDKMNKTRVVLVTRTVRNTLYEKVIRRNKKYYAHDEKNESHIGDKVEIVETKPLSKLKRWRIIKIVSKSH